MQYISLLDESNMTLSYLRCAQGIEEKPSGYLNFESLNKVIRQQKYLIDF